MSESLCVATKGAEAEDHFGVESRVHSGEHWPRISLVMPSYNQGRFLEEAILSVLNQGYPNLEFIIVDGGSTDGSVEIIRRYEHRLRSWISEKDDGQSHAIEKGFAQATGQLLNWINSDDLLFPGALSRIARAWMARPDADLVVGANAFCDAAGHITRISVPPSWRAFSPRQAIMPIGQQSTFFTRDLYDRIGGIRRELHVIMDKELYYRMMKVEPCMVAAGGLVGAWRLHDQTKAVRRVDRWFQERPRFMAANGISRRRQKAAQYWMRLVRCLDGSYWQSWRMTRKLRGLTCDAVST